VLVALILFQMMNGSGSARDYNYMADKRKVGRATTIVTTPSSLLHNNNPRVVEYHFVASDPEIEQDDDNIIRSAGRS
jgi:hypothetical protein